MHGMRQLERTLICRPPLCKDAPIGWVVRAAGAVRLWRVRNLRALWWYRLAIIQRVCVSRSGGHRRVQRHQQSVTYSVIIHLFPYFCVVLHDAPTIVMTTEAKHVASGKQTVGA